jgi:hypothetical protein
MSEKHEIYLENTGLKLDIIRIAILVNNLESDHNGHLCS